MSWIIAGRGRRRRRLGSRAALTGLASVCLLAACQPKPVPEVDVARAGAALAPFKERLLGALTTALEAGPGNAIRVCREVAPQIAAELSVGGTQMGRTSHRLRNPANAPAPWVEPLLAAYVEGTASEPQAVRIDETTFGYVEPIRAVHFCISCHGPAVDETLLEEIRANYPEDRATGFRVGDLRGLFWVEMPLGAAGSSG